MSGLMLVNELARRFGCTRGYLVHEIGRGALVAVKDERGFWTITESAYQRWLRNRRAACTKCGRPRPEKRTA